MKINKQKIGVGATEELNLRVSVASLVRVLFDSPEDGSTMLALERTATLRKIKSRSEVTVTAKPFGGAVQLTNPEGLQGLIGNFNYDSERSRHEKDFRIQIQPGSWEKVKGICQEHLYDTDKDILDSSPERELAEEFEDTLNLRILPEQYLLKPGSMIIEDLPSETDNVRAEGIPTVRIYYIFEARIVDPKIIEMVLVNSKQYSDKDLETMAWNDVHGGGRGRANAILALRLDYLKGIYHSINIDMRGGPVLIGEHHLDGNVLAVLEDVDQSKYHRYIRQ